MYVYMSIRSIIIFLYIALQYIMCYGYLISDTLNYRATFNINYLSEIIAKHS